MPAEVYLWIDRMKKERYKRTIWALDNEAPILHRGWYYKRMPLEHYAHSLDKYGLKGWNEDTMYPLRHLRQEIRLDMLPG